jgi:hypothetical protein
MSDDDLFEWGDGARRRDDGIDRVLRNTPEWYKFQVYMVFWFLLDTGLPFDSQNARYLIGDPPNHHNAIGGVWFGLVKRAMREGYLQVIGSTSARRTDSNKRNLKIYQKISRNGHISDADLDEGDAYLKSIAEAEPTDIDFDYS